MDRKRSLGTLGSVLVVLGGLCLSACGGAVTKFTSSWRPPAAEPLAMRGEPVAAVVMAKNEILRRNAEDVLAGEITHYGAKGIQMYSLMSGSPVDNEQAAKEAIEKAGIKGIVVMRPMGTRTETETHEHHWTPMYNSYWGGYYGYGWNSAWIADYGAPHGAVPTAAPIYYGGATTQVTKSTTTTRILSVEVMVYSLKQNKLVWAGLSETTDPEKMDKVQEFVIRLAALTVKELGSQGLLQSK